MLVTVAIPGIGQQQNDNNELRVLDIRAQQPQAVLAASAPCLHAKESPEHRIVQHTAIDSNSFVQSLAELIQKSDEVVLGGSAYRSASVLSPSRESATTYYEVKVIRSWKGSHNVGDVITFGIPVGGVRCGETESHQSINFSTMVGTAEWKRKIFDGPFLLFLRHPQGKETELVLVQDLIPSAGNGLQGMFPIHIPPQDDAINQCTGVPPDSIRWCASYLETSQYPVEVPYTLDPFAKKYDSMPISDFLVKVRDATDSQGLNEKPMP